MSLHKPHYLLFCDGSNTANAESSAVSNRGKWRFVLEHVESGERTEATDQELSGAPDRTSLLAVLRGLEALEQPSRVTLVTTSRYVSRGLQYGLSEWRENDYSWEHFGTVQPIRNADLWRRIDRALNFHLVQCRFMASGEPQETGEIASSADVAKPHRVYVDTPATPLNAALSVDSTGSTRLPASVTVGGSAGASLALASVTSVTRTSEPIPNVPRKSQRSIRPKLNAHSPEAKHSTRLPSPARGSRLWRYTRSVAIPIVLVLGWIWRQILIVDEVLESCLRCMCLLDPRVEHTRRGCRP